MFFIENEGQAVAGTDYWQSVQAQAGYVYLSWNAGAARLLVPDAAKHLLREMRGAEYVIISKGALHGRDALELVFEDGSEPRANLIFECGGQKEKVRYDDWNGVAAYSDTFNQNFHKEM